MWEVLCPRRWGSDRGTADPHKALKAEGWDQWGFVVCLLEDGANQKRNSAVEKGEHTPCVGSSRFVPRWRRDSLGVGRKRVSPVCAVTHSCGWGVLPTLPLVCLHAWFGCLAREMIRGDILYKCMLSWEMMRFRL